MAFIDELFPSENLRLIHGFQKSISLPVTVVGNGSAEYRIKKLKNFLSTWKYPARLLSTEDRTAILLFMSEVSEFGLYSFKFKDPDLNSWNLTPLTYTGQGNNFYLTSRGTADTHPIFHLGSDVVVKVGSSTSSFTQTVVDGAPVITVPGATSGVTISGTFYHAARFAGSTLSWSLEALNSDNSPFGDNLGDISLQEVFEY